MQVFMDSANVKAIQDAVEHGLSMASSMG